MAGNKAGGLKAAQKIKKLDKDFYRKIGSLGGKAAVESGHLLSVGFASDRNRASEAGRKGGLKSKRKPVDK